jgi:hypothetical protein
MPVGLVCAAVCIRMYVYMYVYMYVTDWSNLEQTAHAQIECGKPICGYVRLTVS